MEFHCTKNQRKRSIIQHVFSSVVGDKKCEQIDAPPLLKAGGQKSIFTENDIAKELEIMVATKNGGADGIPPIFLEKNAKTISKSIKSLVNNIGRFQKFSGS